MIRARSLFVLSVAMMLSFPLAREGGASNDSPTPHSCGDRGRTFQSFEGVCLPDRLVGYIKCVEKLGGNRLRVTKDTTSHSESDVRVEVEGKGEGVVIKGSGQAEVARKKVDESIRKLDVIYGDHASESCLVAAGLGPNEDGRHKQGRIRKPRPSTTKARTMPGSAVREGSTTHQEVNTGSVHADEGSNVRVGVIEGSSSKTVDQKVEVKGAVMGKRESKVDVGVVKQP